MTEENSYYVVRRKRLLHGFDRLARRLRPTLESRYGGAIADEVLRGLGSEV